MVGQFQARHGKKPSKIIIDPLALVSLGLRKSVAPVWNGIPVECREIAPVRPAGEPMALGVHIHVDPKTPKVAALESFDVSA